MKRIRVSSPAERDLDEIWYRIATQSGSMEIAATAVESITSTFALFGNPDAKPVGHKTGPALAAPWSTGEGRNSEDESRRKAQDARQPERLRYVSPPA